MADNQELNDLATRPDVVRRRAWSKETRHMAEAENTVEFYWDMVCPWCWIT